MSREAAQLRAIVRAWHQEVSVLMRRHRSVGLVVERPVNAAIEAASARLAELRRERARSRREARTEEERAAVRESSRAAEAKKPEHYARKRAEWRAANAEKQRQYARDYARRRRAALKAEQLHASGERCPVVFGGGGAFAGLYQAFGVSAGGMGGVPPMLSQDGPHGDSA